MKLEWFTVWHIPRILSQYPYDLKFTGVWVRGHGIGHQTKLHLICSPCSQVLQACLNVVVGTSDLLECQMIKHIVKSQVNGDLFNLSKSIGRCFSKERPPSSGSLPLYTVA